MTYGRKILSSVLLACSFMVSCSAPQSSAPKDDVDTIVGTSHPFASEAIYFLLTDRFVDGDPTNNYPEQGCPDWCTFNRELVGPKGETANIGYLGGDFRGVLNNADYISQMGFTSIWTTPILDNPDAAFFGDVMQTFGGGYHDGGKTGYHGYWATNFFELDEHLVSDGLDFAAFVETLSSQHNLGYVLDIVGNHGSPSYTMRVEQPEFGKVFDKDGVLRADHMNLHPSDLRDDEPLHDWFNRTEGLAKLSYFDPDNQELFDYLIESYNFWLDQGVRAIRVDTIKEQPHDFWKRVSDALRSERPDLFMFGESYSFEADFIAEHTLPENGAYSVLDFPGRAAMQSVFENPQSDYADLLGYLHLNDGPYENPYELVTFLDNHDMSRLNATDENLIDAFNWLFTSRGIPAVYYGSEANFQPGTVEHKGNRNYFGQERIEVAKDHPVQKALTRIANIRKRLPALQRGVQVNLKFDGDIASFYRIYRKDAEEQFVLVLLNKGDAPEVFDKDLVGFGDWVDAVTNDSFALGEETVQMPISIPAHGVRVLVLEGALTNDALIEKAARLSSE